MRPVVRYAVMTALVLVVCILAIIPPEKNLRLGKDLAGGVSLVYGVELAEGDSPDTIDQMISVLKDRVNPQGLFEISMVRQGRDRIEMSMPLPSERVQNLRKAFETELNKLEAYDLDFSAFERALREPPERRAQSMQALIDSEPRRALLQPVIDAQLKMEQTEAAYRAAQAAYDATATAGTPDATLERVAIDSLNAAGEAKDAFEAAKDKVRRSTTSPEVMRAALELSPEGPRVRDSATLEVLTMPSPREEAIKAIKERIESLPGAKETIASIETAYKNYTNERRGLDDPSDLERLLQGAGVLEFRIAVVPGASTDEPRLRQELHERGPDGVQSVTMHWFTINKLEDWYRDTASFKALRDQTAAYFAQNYNLVGEQYGGQFYILLHDEPGLRLTSAEGDWSLTDAFSTQDNFGKPAIGFRMNPKGAMLLGDLTETHSGRQMAILLDDKVYTAPRINDRISSQGTITGTYSTKELQYLIKTLSAGSLHAKLGAKPIGRQVLAPDLGKDNLVKGMNAVWIAFAVIGVFMVIYYYSNGFIAMFALVVNAIIILGAMSLSRAAFTLPGIAGIVLTFGTAVDSNVLIYERIREELAAGNDLRTAVRVAFNKVLSTIVDANVTNLIVCVVLAYVGTQEIKGFGITLGIGVVATMFCALVVTRMIYIVLVDYLKIKKMSQLALTFPNLQHYLTPKVDWIKYRYVFYAFSAVLVGLGVFMIASEGNKLLDTEFRGGTAVTLQLKEDPATGQPMLMARKDVEERVRKLAEEAEARVKSGSTDVNDRVLAELSQAEIVPINPQADGVTSGVHRIKTPIIQTDHKVGTMKAGDTTASDAEILQTALVGAFSDVIESRPALTFTGSNADSIDQAPAHPIVEPTLGANIGRPQILDDVQAYVGGVAIVLENIQPAATEQVLNERLNNLRNTPEYAPTMLKRMHRLVALELNDDRTVKTAVVLAADPSIAFSFDEQRWRKDLAESEWTIVKLALTQPTTLAGVDSFSSEVAATFLAQAVVAVVLSLILVTIYVWVRFGSLRYSLAAMIPLFHDVVVTIGFIGITKFLVDHVPAVRSLGIREFKIDLGLTAAIMTIIGYSLNDTIVILDRIREMRGKLAVASREVINSAVNQCMSRTIITGGSALLSLLVLFIFGGEGVASFSYAMLVGTVVGTYSTVAIAAPIVWQKKVPPSDETTVVRRTPDALPAAEPAHT